MPSENPFRWSLILMFVVTMSIAVYFRRKAAASGEAISHQEEGYVFAAVLRLAGLCVGISTLAYLVSPASMQWASIPLPPMVRWIGAASGGLSSYLMCWTLSSLGKNLTDTVVIRTDATLVTVGPYRWVRHPFYVATALLMASATVMAANWLIGLGSAIVLTLLAVRTPKEEQMLLERFGQQYRDYMKRTGRFFPKLRA